MSLQDRDTVRTRLGSVRLNGGIRGSRTAHFIALQADGSILTSARRLFRSGFQVRNSAPANEQSRNIEACSGANLSQSHFFFLSKSVQGMKAEIAHFVTANESLLVDG